jgi:hypothetical protein
MTTSSALGEALQALAEDRWEEAASAFAAAGNVPEALDGMGRALWWLSDIAGAVEAWERSYSAGMLGEG